MEQSIWYRWNLMEAKPNILITKPELNMALDTATLNALKNLSYMERPHLPPGVTTVLAVLNSISGRPINKPPPIQLILARKQVTTDAMGIQIAASITQDIAELAIRMDAGIMLSETVIKCSTGQVRIIK